MYEIPKINKGHHICTHSYVAITHMSWQRLLARAKRPLLWRSYKSVLGLLKPLTSSCFLLRHSWERSVWPWLCTSHPSCWRFWPIEAPRKMSATSPSSIYSSIVSLSSHLPSCWGCFAHTHTHLFFSAVTKQGSLFLPFVSHPLNSQFSLKLNQISTIVHHFGLHLLY